MGCFICGATVQKGSTCDGCKPGPLQVCQSAAGYYIGRLTRNGMPYSRESTEYFPTLGKAQEALVSGEWTSRSYY